MTDTAVTVDSMAHGGSGVGRSGGKVVFVPGTVPGDVVEVDVVTDKPRYARAAIRQMLEASPDRVQAPCPVFGECGGCDWQMMRLGSQREWKRDILVSQLAHLGSHRAPPVGETRAVGPGLGYRNRIDLQVKDRRPALYARGSKRLVALDGCPLVIPEVGRLVADFEPGERTQAVTIRGSSVTGETVILEKSGRRWSSGRIHEEVAGRRFQVSDRAFFQVNTPGAEALVELVAEWLAPGSGDSLLDGYAGGGLFSATVGSQAGAVTAVESERRALADLAVNAPEAEVVEGRFEEVDLEPVDLAVVDPPRAGLGRDGVEAVIRAGPRRLAYVSCDPAALARDTSLLADSGYELVAVTPVDMFPQTHHIEAMAAFRSSSHEG